ncbi:MAG: integrase core domain-containing protein, partial [Gordonibacter sp.]
ERWFRTLKSEWLRLNEYETPRELREGISQFVELYNNDRLHESLDYETPAKAYFGAFAQAA